MGRVVVKMAYGEKAPEKFEIAKNNLPKLSWTMYFPQIIMLTIAFILGIYIPKFLYNTIVGTIIG